MHQHHRQRLTALRTLAELAEQHQLLMPRTIGLGTGPTRPMDSLELILDEEERAGVTAWADILGLTLLPECTLTTHGEDWQRVKATATSHDPAGHWSGFQLVDVWAVCDVRPASTTGGAA